jgi:hypothetical protein
MEVKKKSCRKLPSLVFGEANGAPTQSEEFFVEVDSAGCTKNPKKLTTTVGDGIKAGEILDRKRSLNR